MGWNRAGSTYRRLCTGALLSLALAAGQTPAAHSQIVVQASSGTVTAVVGVSGTVANTQANLAGRFGVLDNVVTGTLMDQVITTIKQSYVTVRIDGGPPSPGSNATTQKAPGWDLIWGDVGSNALDASTTGIIAGEGQWVLNQQPRAVGNTIVAKWETLAGANLSFPIPHIEIDLVVSFVHDMVSFRFTIINRDNRSHTIGLRFAQDVDHPGTGVTATGPDGPLFASTVSPIVGEVDLVGSLVPAIWRGFYPSDSTVGGVLQGQAANSSITRPDRLTFGAPVDAAFPLWDFTIDPTVSFTTATGDAAVGVYFSPREYFAGENTSLDGRDIITYFGRNHSTINFDGNFPAGVDAPFSIKFDPSKAVGKQFTPSPFAIVGFVQNTKLTPLQNVQAVISLPPGLALAPTETLLTKPIGTVASGSEGTVSWQVVPTGTATGVQRIGMSFAASPGSLGTSVTREIELPALPSHTFDTGATGIAMVSFPFTFDDPTPTAALGLSAIDFDLLRWNPVTLAYEAVTRIQPSEGYWLRLATRTVNLNATHPVAVGIAPFEIPLRNGWEQIGNPFLYNVRWADIQVILTDANDPNALVPVDILTAASRGWIISTIYSYDPATGEYQYDTDLTTNLVPFQGYWVKALRSNISLLVPPTGGRAAKLPTSSGGAARGRSVTVPNGWTMRLSAKGQHTQDTFNFIGLSGRASDGIDIYDVEKPPAVQGAVRLGMVHPNWGRRAGSYSTDIQAMGGRKQWDVVVTSAAPNENVTLSWPDISRVPRGYELYITDKSTNQRKLMRQMSSLQVNMGAAASRAFTITAEPRTVGNSALMLNASVVGMGRAVGAAKITVNSNVDASFSVRVMSPNGQPTRLIIAGRAATAGKDTSIIWDGKDGRGVSVPSGTYNIEVKGVTPDGQTAKQVVPYLIVR